MNVRYSTTTGFFVCIELEDLDEAPRTNAASFSVAEARSLAAALLATADEAERLQGEENERRKASGKAPRPE